MKRKSVVERACGWQTQWNYFNEIRTVEFDIYFESDSVGESSLLFYLDDAGRLAAPPYVVDLIPGWLGLSGAARHTNWFHIVVDLPEALPVVDAFSGFLLYNNSPTARPHFRLANVKLGWLDNTTPPVLTTPAVSFNSTNKQLSFTFATDQPALCAVEYGITNYDHRVWSANARDWVTYEPTARPFTNHAVVISDPIPGATYQFRVVALNHRTDPDAAPNKAIYTGTVVIPGPPYVVPAPAPLTYVTAYDSTLQGSWIRVAWEQSASPIFSDFAAAAPGRPGNAIEVRFGAANGSGAFGLSDERPGADYQWKHLNEFRTVEFDLYFENDSVGESRLQFLLDEAGGLDAPPYLVDLLPGWLDKSAAERHTNWFHVTVNLPETHPKWSAFHSFRFYNDSGDARPHFRIANVRLGWSPDATPPVISLQSQSLNLTYDKFTVGFTTDEPALCQLQFGVSSPSRSVVLTPRDWLPFNPYLTPMTNYTGVLTNLVPGTTYQYRITAFDYRTDPNASANQGSLTGTFAVPLIPLTPPTLSALTIAEVTANRATVSWMTDRPCMVQLTYRKNGGALLTRTLSDFGTNRSVVIDLLEALTPYSVTVTVTDAFHLSTSQSASFTTGAAATPTVTITADASRKSRISPWIYGINDVIFWDGANFTRLNQKPWAPRNLTLNRYGGNRWTAYNWENNASNAGSDYIYNSDDFLGGGAIPAEAVRGPIAESRAAGQATLLTLQLQGYVAADKNGPVALSDPNHLSSRFKQVAFQKGLPFSATPSSGDDFVFMDEFLWALRGSFTNDIYADPARPTFVSLDNEPELWPFTHPQMQSGAMNSDDFIRRTISLCNAVKDVAPAAQTFGPVHYGFNGIVNWQNESGFPSAGGYWFTDKYLLALRSASETTGRRLLDVYDIHWYAEGRAGAAADAPAVGSLRGANLSAEEIQAVVQSPRSFWDTTYRENSWIADYLGGPIHILSRLQDKINNVWPGTKLAVTEYNNGGDNHIAGALAQADNLGIFAQQGIFAATYWPMWRVTSFPWRHLKCIGTMMGSSGVSGTC